MLAVFGHMESDWKLDKLHTSNIYLIFLPDFIQFNPIEVHARKCISHIQHSQQVKKLLGRK